MSVTGVSSYANMYAQSTYTSSSTKETISSTQEETTASTRTTAAEELAYLTQNYSNYSFVSADYTQGMTYGSSATVNVAISPQFLEKMANDSELEAEYEEQIALMQEIDERLIRTEAAKGYKLQTGWAIDKDGGISKWGIGTKDNKKSYLQTMSENAAKIREKAIEKKKEQKKTEEKRLEKKQLRKEYGIKDRCDMWFYTG
ncbi:MAG: DUF6033 family protein [Lachnospiraceae bacterium]|nr:DUF6033 family protein [Lachnospiraceae bacterium]